MTIDERDAMKTGRVSVRLFENDIYLFLKDWGALIYVID